MWPCCVVLAALLSGPVRGAAGAAAVAPLRQVEAPCRAELTLRCGDGNPSGGVRYWHTPFGDLRPGPHSHLEPGYLQQEGHLVLPSVSSVHRGLYYCLLQGAGGTTLCAHDVHVSPGPSGCDPPTRRAAGGPRTDAGAAAGASPGPLAGAVAGSVLLTFVVGFSAGALCRSQVLRCLEALGARLRSPRARARGAPDYASEVAMATASPVVGSHVVEMEQADASVPPAKPQRSFREKRQEEEERVHVTTQVFEKETEEEEEERERGAEKRYGHTKKVKDKDEDGEGGRGLADKSHLSEEETGDDGERGQHERHQWCDEESEGGDLQEVKTFQDGEKTFTPAEGCEETETCGEIDERVRKEGKGMNNAPVEEKGENSGQESGSREPGEPGEPGRRNCEETDGSRGEEERWREEREDDGETESEEEEEEEEEEEGSPVPGPPPGSPGPRPGRPSRVIRLYEYDEEGLPFDHAPQGGPEGPGPAPRLQQRSISLTRLGAIMAAASAGPLGPKGPDRPEGPPSQRET